MAPGLNGRQTGTVPKNKPRNSGSQSHRSTRDALIHFASLDWEPVTDTANRNRSHRKTSTAHSETEADSLRYDVNRSRSSTMTSQQHLVDNDNGEISWLNGNGSEDGNNSISNASSRQSSHRSRQHNTWPNHPVSAVALPNGSSSQESQGTPVNIPDRKQVINKLAVIQDYIQQTATLMSTLKASDSPSSKTQYEKLLAVLDDLKDSEAKLSSLLNNMDRTESRIDDLLADIESNQFCQENAASTRMQKFNQIVNENYGPMGSTNMGNNNNVVEPSEEELLRRSEESKRKVEALEKRKQDLIELHEKAKRQLHEAQAEEGRLIASANSLNQELNASKLMEHNLQQLNQRLNNIQQVYRTRNQIRQNLNDNEREEAEHPDEDQAELSDTETDYQLVSDKMAELAALKAQLSQLQNTMATIHHREPSGDEAGSATKDTAEGRKESSQGRNEAVSLDGPMTANALKLEQAKSKLTQLTNLLDVIQNSTGLSPSYIQMVSNLVKDEGGSSTHSPSPSCSGRSQPRPGEEMSIEAMQLMTRELEERTAAMKEERDKLIAARQHLQNVASKIPIAKRPETESLSPDDDSESEAPCLLPSNLDSAAREVLNATISTETEQVQSCSESSPYVCRTAPSKGRQRASWNTSLPVLAPPPQERRCKNDTLSRASNQSSLRGGSRSRHRDPGRWSPSPAASFSEAGLNPVIQTQNQLEMTNNLCERMLADTLTRGQQRNEVSLDELFAQHQMLTKTVAQCSQLIWLQQKQIAELRNAVILHQIPPLPNPGASNQVHINNQPQLNPLQPPQFINLNPPPSITVQPQNFPPPKLNAGDLQNPQILQDYQDELFNQGLNYPFPVMDGFNYDPRYGNFNRFNPQQINPPSASNLNQNLNQNPTVGLNNRVPNGMNCIGPEDSGALNNQVPPGNRANNYWDNFRSYSRQNLLSNTKSNEETDTTRRILSTNQERLSREGAASLAAQNNPSSGSQTNIETSSGDQFLLPVNARSNPLQITRSRSVEPQNLRNTVKNESRSQENDSRNLNPSAGKNETGGGGGGGARLRNPDSSSENIRNVRNDVSQGGRNLDNVNHTRNFVHLGRDLDNDEVAQGNNKKRVEKSRCRNESRGNLNSRSDINNGLFLVLRDNVYSEVTNFIRANENRPHFLIQLFRDLQQVTTDSLRQRTLESIQETVNANNLTERANVNGSNLNIIENRNNIRENRSNLNRNQPEDHIRIDELFYHLRENQNTIRQNIGSANFPQSGNNLENPNISNIRDLSNSRNNLENEGLRDLRTYYANLCNFGQNSELENPNLSNIRENLTRRTQNPDYENVNPKNVYLSMYDNIVEDLRRRNQESGNPDFVTPFENFRNFEDDNLFDGNRGSNNQFSIGSMPALDNNFEIREENQFSTDNRSRFGLLDRGDNFLNGRDFMANGNNDSGIDINFNNDDRKRNFLDGATACEGGLIPKKNEQSNDEEEGAVALMPADWERNSLDNNSFISSLSLPRYEISSFSDTVCEKSSFVNCSPHQQSDNGDLAEADQSRNEETSGAESDSGFVNLQTVEPESTFAIDQNPETAPESNFSLTQNHTSEAESNFQENSAMEPEGNFVFKNSASEPEGNFTRGSENNPDFQWNENTESVFHLNSSSESETGVQKSGKYSKKRNESSGKSENTLDFKKGPVKNLTNKFRDNTFGQMKVENSNSEEFDVQRTETDGNSLENRESDVASGSFSPLQNFQFGTSEIDRGNASPEAEADWEMENGLDQVPTRLEKNNGSPKKSP